MVKNWKNYYTDNAVHHVTGTVHNWQPILLFPDIVAVFYQDFSQMLNRWNVNLLGYVIMPEHFHMLIQSYSSKNIMNFIRGGRRSISGKVKHIIENKDKKIISFCAANNVSMNAFYIKTAGKSSFRFWKEKPRIFPITKETEIERKLDYIHNNPIKRGLVNSIEEWKHSSFRYYANSETVGLPINSWPQDVVRLGRTPS